VHGIGTYGIAAIASATIAATIVAGCGGRCRDVERARQRLAHVGTRARGPDLEVTVPYDQANAVIAKLLAREPLAMSLASPVDVVVFEGDLTATVTGLEVQPAEQAGQVRFAIAVAVTHGDEPVGAIDAVLEVEPVLTHAAGDDELAIGFGPQRLVHARPTLAPGTKEQLTEVVQRLIPDRVKQKLGTSLLASAAARRLGGYLTGQAWKLIRERLGPRLGDLATLRLRLPDVPVARTAVRSTPHQLVVDVFTELPVRSGLRTRVDEVGAAPSEVGVRLSGSTVAELANWALDHGQAPAWYSRAGKPSANGQYRPRFDYVAGDRGHPLKLYSFQERGGCSYFRIGAKPAVTLDRDRLRVTVLDQRLEGQAANPVVELAAWSKYALAGSVDESKQVVAHTRLSVGGRVLETRVTSASIAGDELRFGLRFEVPAS